MSDERDGCWQMRLRYVRLYPANHIDPVMFVKYTRADEPFTFILLFYQTYRVSPHPFLVIQCDKDPCPYCSQYDCPCKGTSCPGPTGPDMDIDANCRHGYYSYLDHKIDTAPHKDSWTLVGTIYSAMAVQSTLFGAMRRYISSG